MRNSMLKCLLVLLVVAVSVADADAQRRSRTRGSTQPARDTVPTTNQPQQTVNNNQTPTYNPYGNTKIVVAPQTGGFNDTTKPSLRNDAAYNKDMLRERTPLPYEDLRWDDALFTERVWREIDVREKI